MNLSEYTMQGKGDANTLDYNTRRNMIGHDNFVQFARLSVVVGFIVGMIVGSTLHDAVFHAVEQVMK